MVRYKRLGLMLAMARKYKGLTQSQLAEETGVSAKWISTIETGKEKPSQELAEKIAVVFDSNVKDVFGEEIK